MERILIAGATGYLGGYIAGNLDKKECFVRLLVRNPEKPGQKKIKADEIIVGEVTKAETIKDCCESIDVVISTVGITRQKDKLGYMDVDYQANLNLLREVKRVGSENLSMFRC